MRCASRGLSVQGLLGHCNSLQCPCRILPGSAVHWAWRNMQCMALLHALLSMLVLATANASGGDGSTSAVLHLPTDADAGVATHAAALAYTISPSKNGTLLAGQDLVQVPHPQSASSMSSSLPVIFLCSCEAQLAHERYRSISEELCSLFPG